MMRTCEIASARPTFEQELLKRMNAVAGVAPTLKPPCKPHPAHCTRCSYYNRQSWPVCDSCLLCFVCGIQNCQGCYEDPAEVPVSFINQLVKLLILSHTEKCTVLKNKCFELFTSIEQINIYKSQFVMAVQKLEQHPDLLGEIVLHYRGITR